MTDPTPPQPPVDLAPDSTAPHTADELFAHGLLTHITRETPALREQRVGRVLGALHAEHTAGPLAFLGRTPARWIGIAATIAIASVALYFTGSVQSSAQAVLQQSITALRGPGDRRYDLRVLYEDSAPDKDPDQKQAQASNGTIDTRDGGLLLLRFRAPSGREVIVGRDEISTWAIRMDGGIEREHPERAWPKWASIGDEDIVADSVDRLVEALSKDNALERRGVEELEGRNGRRFAHIAGERTGAWSPGAARVELWIDRDTKLIERLEMRWDGRLPRGPEARNLPRPPRPDGAPIDENAHPDPDRPAPEHPDFAPPGRPFPPDADRPRLRPGPGPGPGPGPEGQRRPRQLMPPKLLVLERAKDPTFEPGWFSPELHVNP